MKPQKKVPPLLRWPGSKMSLIAKMSEHIPMEGELLLEPFAGSCSFSLNTNYQKYVINDLNTDLINLYKMVKNTPDLLIKELSLVFKLYPNEKQTYISLREEYNQERCPTRRAVLFFWISKHCFNGLIRYNLSGGYNVPFGTVKNPHVSNSRIHEVSEAFKKFSFHNECFDTFLQKNIKPGCTVFSDPPYLPVSKTANFTSYTARVFTVKDHIKLDILSHKTKLLGGQAYVTNHDVPLRPEIYSLASSCISYNAKRTISAKGVSRKKASEVLIVYK